MVKLFRVALARSVAREQSVRTHAYSCFEWEPAGDVGGHERGADDSGHVPATGGAAPAGVGAAAGAAAAAGDGDVPAVLDGDNGGCRQAAAGEAFCQAAATGLQVAVSGRPAAASGCHANARHGHDGHAATSDGFLAAEGHGCPAADGNGCQAAGGGVLGATASGSDDDDVHEGGAAATDAEPGGPDLDDRDPATSASRGLERAPPWRRPEGPADADPPPAVVSGG